MEYELERESELEDSAEKIFYTWIKSQQDHDKNHCCIHMYSADNNIQYYYTVLIRSIGECYISRKRISTLLLFAEHLKKSWKVGLSDFLLYYMYIRPYIVDTCESKIFYNN